MAIAFARVRYLSRTRGDNAARTAAYNARDRIRAERTGEVFSFRHRDAPVYHAVMLPSEAGEQFADPAVLWNTAEASEHRRDSQVAREIVLALPANAEITPEDRIAMARSFAEAHFTSKGVAVQIDIHAPDEATESEQENWHAHLLITTRRLGQDAFDRVKARDLDPIVRASHARPHVVEGELWGEQWRAHQDEYFRAQGLELRVAPSGIVPQPHGGPRRMRRGGTDIAARIDATRKGNLDVAHDPNELLEKLTRNSATFTSRDLDRFLTKHLGDAGEEAGVIEAVRDAVLTSPDLVTLYNWQTKEASGRFTTQTIRSQEQAAMVAAHELASRAGNGVSPDSADAAAHTRALRPDQQAAFGHATSAGGLKLIEGRAGTGKSYTLSAIRDAYQRDGRQVVGLAPTNVVAQDMAADGFTKVSTVHSLLWQLQRGSTHLDANTVLMVDEAAMLDARTMGSLLAKANSAGAKLILVGDDRQLPSIERGGLFTQLLKRHGSTELTDVVRQSVDWQRQAARDLANYRFVDAVAAFERGGMITWTDEEGDARAALVDAWKRDRAAHPEDTSFVFAYTNRDVDTLNAELRQICRDRGELSGADVTLTMRRGDPAFEQRETVTQADFAVGDRVQFTKTDKSLRIYNGNVGTITSIEPETGKMRARLDAVGRSGREVEWDANEFQGFRHGYAGTIHKGQGKTIDRTYLYHSKHWTSAPSYVALTRQRKSANVFVARETAANVRQLAQQMERTETNAASLAWAAQDELVTVRAAQGACSAGEVEIPLDIGQGRARFRERYEANLRQREHADIDGASGQKLVADWDQRIARFRRALPRMDKGAAYGKVRKELLDFAETLAQQSALVALLRQQEEAFGVIDRPMLRHLLASSDPTQALAAVVAESESSMRARWESAERELLAKHIETRPRDERPSRK